jgi:prophage regulatory protein
MPRRKKYQLLLTRKDLKARGITFCPTHLLRLIKRGDFPAPIRLGQRKRFWDEEEIDAWIARRAGA